MSCRRRAGRRQVALDNRYVVPFNRYLLRRFKCHINVEICATTQAVKYKYKYIFKEHDLATLQVHRGQGEVDEPVEYVSGRYAGSPEVAWRMFGFGISKLMPSVERLPFHLPDQQVVVYPEDGHLAEQVEQEAASKLMAYFDFNSAKWEEYERLQ